MSSILHRKFNLQTFSQKRLSYISKGIIISLFLIIGVLLLSPQNAEAQHALPAYQAVADQPHNHAGHSSSMETNMNKAITVSEAVFYTVRILYYVSFMLTVGFMLWSIMLEKESTDTQRLLVNKWSHLALRTFLIAVLLFVFFHSNSLLKSGESRSFDLWIDLLTKTELGYTWLGLIALSLLGFIVLKLHGFVKMLWVLLLAVDESFNGHVSMLSSRIIAIILDAIHLIAAAALSGGLVLLLLFWLADRKESGRFAERYTRVTFLLLVIITVSGIGMSVILLPSRTYLIYTSWGIMLIVNALLTLLVGGVGLLLRARAKRHELPNGNMLKLNVALVCIILVIVGVITNSKPIPHMDPFSYHRMGNSLHFTLYITPNGPGPNQVKLRVWLPEQLGAPAEVNLELREDAHPLRTPIVVPLQSDFSRDELSFPGFTETGYIAAKVELSSRGAWTAALTIIDQSGAEMRQSIPFRND